MVHGPAIALKLQCNGLAMFGVWFELMELQHGSFRDTCVFETQVLGAGLVAEVEPGNDWLISTPKYHSSIILSIQNS